ncbi:hypothetical protein HAZT_HAZT002905, partial [Hyalella azteca]
MYASAKSAMSNCRLKTSGILVTMELGTASHRPSEKKGTNFNFQVRGLYRGMASPMAGVGAVNAVIFGVHGSVSKRFEDPDALKSHFTAGVCAGFVQAFIASPVELTKTRLQIQADIITPGSNVAPKYTGPLQCAKHILRTEGFRGLFRGQLITIMREIPGFGTYFLWYEWMARKLSGNDSGSAAGPLSVLVAGGSAGTASWLVTYPIDVIKSRIQSDGAFGPKRYNGMVDCFRTSVKEEGWMVLTRGLNSTLLRAFPTNAATFFVVTSVLKTFSPESSDETSGTSLALTEIYRTAELIMHAAGAAHDVYDHHKGMLKKLKENHLANFLPIVVAASKTSSQSASCCGEKICEEHAHKLFDTRKVHHYISFEDVVHHKSETNITWE